MYLISFKQIFVKNAHISDEGIIKMSHIHLLQYKNINSHSCLFILMTVIFSLRMCSKKKKKEKKRTEATEI